MTKRTGQTSVERMLSDGLAQADRALSGVAPVISHLLESPGRALVSDAIVGRLRAMLDHLARQLLGACAGGIEVVGENAVPETAIDELAALLARDCSIVSHLYALALESQLTDRIERRASIDPVLSALLQELIASDNPTTAALAMRTLAAQSRFVQSQRRMHLALGELPAELFAGAMAIVGDYTGGRAGSCAASNLEAFRNGHDESTTRLGLIEGLLDAMGGGALATLELDHAGFALFASGLASMTDQPRDLAILACHERQTVRLALSLRAAGQGAATIERQFVLLAPDDLCPDRIDDMPPDRAAALLGSQNIPSPQKGAV